MKLYEQNKNLFLNSAKRGATVVRNDSYITIVKPTKGLKSVGFVLTLNSTHKEFYCDNVCFYGGKIFCTGLGEQYISMFDITTGQQRLVDKLEFGPNFAIVESSSETKVEGEKFKTQYKEILQEMAS